MHVVVLVLGDVGRSPRMQYHTLSLADHVDKVSLVGFDGEPCVDALEQHPKINKVMLAGGNMFNKLPRKLFLLYAPLKVVHQVAQLFLTLNVSIETPDVILIQNPPCIPTFAVAGLTKLIRGSRIIIDWHNLGYTILSMNVGSRKVGKLVVRLAQVYERLFAKVSDHNFCVTDTMKQWLADNFELRRECISVLYDKSPQQFKTQVSPSVAHDLFLKLGAPFAEDEQTSKFTVCDENGTVTWRQDRPALIVSSTSWTPDEDFGVLLDAMVLLEKRLETSELTRPVILVVTGKGPQRAMYEEKIKTLALQRIHILTLWVVSADYPVLLAASDLGVCLHTSSSGLDLPMKVVDMFGAGIPVCAIHYECIAKELVLDGENGRIFHNSHELSDQLFSLLVDDGSEVALERLRNGVLTGAETRRKWSENWNLVAWPVIEKTGRRTVGGCPSIGCYMYYCVYAIFLVWFVYVQL